MSPRPGPQFVEVLQRFMPATTARIVVQSCLDPHRKVDDVTAAEAPRLTAALVNATRFFVQPQDRDRLIAALNAIARTGAELKPRTITLTQENDLSVARITAKDLAESLGASSLQAQKAATAVSELSRNVLDYAKRGQVELIPLRGPPAKLRIVATDSGGGIPNLEQILSGKYRSKTGMGLGLLGVKRMADRFDVQTGKAGTRVEVEVLL